MASRSRRLRHSTKKNTRNHRRARRGRTKRRRKRGGHSESITALDVYTQALSRGPGGLSRRPNGGSLYYAGRL